MISVFVEVIVSCIFPTLNVSAHSFCYLITFACISWVRVCVEYYCQAFGECVVKYFSFSAFCFVSHRVFVLMRHFVFGLASGNVMFIVFSPGLCLKTTHTFCICVFVWVWVCFTATVFKMIFFPQLVLFIIIIGIVIVFIWRQNIHFSPSWDTLSFFWKWRFK